MTAAAGSNILFTSVILAKESHMLVNTMDFLYKLKKKTGMYSSDKATKKCKQVINKFYFYCVYAQSIFACPYYA